MNAASALKFSAFDPAGFPEGVDRSDAVEYVRCYLADLDAASVVEEPNYFDRDYLAEFSAFYSTSSRGYPNVCRRLHVFKIANEEIQARLSAALRNETGALETLQEHYLGFVVIRPIRATPFGRTVLRWYPDTRPASPRVTRPARKYDVHLAGLRLRVTGLAWQQQDSAVGACATVALWTMLHASALDEHHAVPTTVEITRSAKMHWPASRRIFPASEGLVVEQLFHAIKAQGLQPAVLDGDVPFQLNDVPEQGFSRDRFAASCAACIRSGYPAFIACHVLENGKFTDDHAICAVGFRRGPMAFTAGMALEDDGALEHLYVHDDNLGPSVRFSVREWATTGTTLAALHAAPPPPYQRPPAMPNPTTDYSTLVPFGILTAMPDEIRMTSDFLNGNALHLAAAISEFLNKRTQVAKPAVTFSSGFLRVSEYLRDELPRRLTGSRLEKARLGLVNDVRPMSLHVGVVRIGVDGSPLLDVLLDTTDSEPATDAFAHVLFQRFPVGWLRDFGELGVGIETF